MLTLFSVLLVNQSRAGSPSSVQRFLTYEDYKYCERLGVDPLVPIAIAGVESDWNPFILRVNSRKKIVVKGVRTIRKIGRNVFYCHDKATCTALAYALIRKGFRNIDLGAFQLNYYHQKKRDGSFSPEIAFDVRKAYRKVCRIVAGNFKLQGRTANAVALFHSARPKRNYWYAKKFWRIYTKLKEGK